MEKLYRINGNILGTQYSLPKLMWLRDNTPEVYNRAWKFLLWSGFVSFMLGAEPCVDHSLAGRTLLFDVDARAWSPRIADAAGIDLEKMPAPVAGGDPDRQRFRGRWRPSSAWRRARRSSPGPMTSARTRWAAASSRRARDERHGDLPVLRAGIHGAQAARRPWSAGA